ncbi:MAG TPA: hypothetical protein VF817_01825 [Patescibacteria group bacterium]
MALISEKELQKVRNLYYKEGLSMQDIADKFEVGIGAVIYFMRRHELPRRKSNESNAIRYGKLEASFKLKKLKTEKLRTLKVIGTMLYWGEGYKSDKGSIVDFANSDKDMIALFMKFLREVCGIDEKKLRVYCYFYSNQNIKQNINYWSKITKIDKKQFTKPYIRTDFDKTKIDKMSHGMIHIRYADKKLLNLIKDWIRKYREI